MGLFFAELRAGCVPMASVSVFLVGDGGVGKTTLKVKALLGRDPLSAGEWVDSIVGAVLRFGVYFICFLLSRSEPLGCGRGEGVAAAERVHG